MSRVRTLLLLLAVLSASSSSLAGRPRPSPLRQLKSALGEAFAKAVGNAVEGAVSAGDVTRARAAEAEARSDDPTAEDATDANRRHEPKDIPDDGAHLKRRVLVESPLSPWIQPTTFLRVALLIIRNAALDNPAAGFLQTILTTELAYTAFTNVFASFAAGVVQDFSTVRDRRGEGKMTHECCGGHPLTRQMLCSSHHPTPRSRARSND